MSRFKPFQSAVCAALCLLGVGTASAALMNRGGGMIYDTDLNITWLADASYGAGSAFDDGASPTDGLMSWVCC